jgi:hypothetical protein
LRQMHCGDPLCGELSCPSLSFLLPKSNVTEVRCLPHLDQILECDPSPIWRRIRELRNPFRNIGRRLYLVMFWRFVKDSELKCRLRNCSKKDRQNRCSCENIKPVFHRSYLHQFLNASSSPYEQIRKMLIFTDITICTTTCLLEHSYESHIRIVGTELILTFL